MSVERRPDGIDLWVVLPRVWAARGRIAVAMLAAGLLALGVVSLMPRYYRAQASLLPPAESDLMRNLVSGYRVIKKFPVFGVLGNYHTPADVFLAVLESEHVHRNVAERFDLQRVYRASGRDETLRTLRRRFRAVLAPDGTISFWVEDRDPRRAAAMATAFLEELDRMNVAVRQENARQLHQALGRRAHEADSLLQWTETALRRYQTRHHAVIPSLDHGAIDAAAELMARKLELEVRLGVLGTQMAESGDEVQAAQTELVEVERRIAALPEIQGELERLTRDRGIQERIVQFLHFEIEHARVRERMETPTVEVLDAPLTPERHARPPRAKTVMLTMVLAALAASIAYGLRGSDG